MAEQKTIKKLHQAPVFPSKFRRLRGAANSPAQATSSTSTQAMTPVNPRTPRFILPDEKPNRNGGLRAAPVPAHQGLQQESITPAPKKAVESSQLRQFSSAPRFKVPLEVDLPLSRFANSPLSANRQQKAKTTAAPKTPLSKRPGTSLVDEDIVDLYTSDAENDGIDDESPLKRGQNGISSGMGQESPISDSPVKSMPGTPRASGVQDGSSEDSAMDTTPVAPRDETVAWTMVLTPRSRKRDANTPWNKRRRISPSSSPLKRLPTLRREDSISTITSSPPGTATPVAVAKSPSPSLRSISPSPGSDFICNSEASQETPFKPPNSSPLPSGRGDGEAIPHEAIDDADVRSPLSRRIMPPTFETPAQRPSDRSAIGTTADSSTGWKRPRFLFNPTATSTPTPPITPGGALQTPLRKIRPRFNIPSPMDGSLDPTANFYNDESLISPPPPSLTPTAPLHHPGPGSDQQQKKRRYRKNKPPKFVHGGMAAEARSWLLDIGARKDMTMQMLAQQQQGVDEGSRTKKQHHAFTAIVVDARFGRGDGGFGHALVPKRAGHVANFYLLTVDIQDNSSAERRKATAVNDEIEEIAARRVSLLLFGKQLSLPSPPTTLPSSRIPYTPAPNDVIGVRRGLIWDIELARGHEGDSFGHPAESYTEKNMTCNGREQSTTKRQADHLGKRKWTVALEWDVLAYGND